MASVRYSGEHLAWIQRIGNLEPDEIASAKLTIDSGVEQGEVSVVLCDLKPNTDRPDMFRHQRALLPNEASLVPGGAVRTNGR